MADASEIAKALALHGYVGNGRHNVDTFSRLKSGPAP
jgi:hypothetical protein